jgi:steroid delta-isomerase-like uncharacterized protein
MAAIPVAGRTWVAIGSDGPAVGPQYDTTHVYVAPEDVDRFVSCFLATFGGTSTKQAIVDVTPTPSSTSSQLLQSPVGTVSLFGFRTGIPYPFGAERSGYLVRDFDEAVKLARAVGADVIVAPFNDPIGRDAVVQWPGGVNMQLYWHVKSPSYAAFQTVPENRVYVSPERADRFVKSFVAFSHGKVVSDDKVAPGVEIGLPDGAFRRIRIESDFGKLTAFVTDGHLPYPYGRETTGYEVANLDDTLAKAETSGAEIIVKPFSSDGRQAAMVRFPGGYVAEIHSGSYRTLVFDVHRGKPKLGPITHADLDTWAAAWSSHNVDTAMALFDKDVTIDQPANPKPLTYAAARKFFGMIFKAYPDFHVRLVKAIVDGYDAVSVEQVTGTWSGTYTDPATGKSNPGNGRHFDHPGAMVIHYKKNHKIDHVSIYWDQLTVDRQLGIKPN